MIYFRGSLVMALVRSLVRGRSVFKYLRDRSLVFSNFLHEVRAPQGYKSDKARFLRKNLGEVTNGGKPPFWGYF